MCMYLLLLTTYFIHFHAILSESREDKGNVDAMNMERCGYVATF